MKNRKTNFIKLGILLFGISIFLLNCEKDETIINQNTESLENDIFLNKTYLKIKEELNVQIDLKNNSPYQSKNNNVKFETKFGKPFYKKAFTIDTEFNTVIIPTQNVNNKKLKGWLSGYYVNGKIINFRYIFATKEEIEKIDIEQLITQESKQKSKTKSNYNAKGCTLYFETKCVGFHFPGVVEPDWVCKEYFAGANCTTDQPTLEESSWINPLEERQGGGGSGGAIDNDYCNKLGLVYDPVLQTCVEDVQCPEGQTEDENGNCVEDPCKYIKLQIQNPNYTAQANELKGKTGLKKETGYKQNKDGKQVPLTVTNNGHSLKIPIDGNTTGYMHTHLNDFNAGDIDNDGIDDTTEPIRMFSPADIINFVKMVNNTKSNGVPTHLVYATMISSSGNYTLRFTGNVDTNFTTNANMLNSPNSYKTVYEKYIEKKGSVKGFLHFMKDYIKIKDINLYRIRDNGDIEKKTLKTNGRVDTNDC